MATIEQEMRRSREAANQVALSREQRELLDRAKRSESDFMSRLRNKDPRRINNPDGTHSTHLMSWATDDRNRAIIFPEIQPDEEGNLRNYGDKAIDRAIERKDTLMTTPELADWFTQNYKTYFPVE